MKPYTQQTKSSVVNISLEGEISNSPWSRRNQMRPSFGKKVLSSYPSIRREPHIGDQ